MKDCNQLITDPKSNRSRGMLEDLSIEEMGGVEDMSNIFRIITLDRKTLRKELEHLERSLKK